MINIRLFEDDVMVNSCKLPQTLAFHIGPEMPLMPLLAIRDEDIYLYRIVKS